MKTLKDVFRNKNEIVALAQEFGYLPDVRVFCDEPEDAPSELVLIVKSDPEKERHFESPIFLQTLLWEMLGCKVDVRPLEAIVMYKEHMVLHSVPIEKETDVTKLFAQDSPQKVLFDDTKKPHPIGLENAHKHLASLRSKEQKMQGERDSKKPKSEGDSLAESDSPTQGNTESPHKVFKQ